MTDEQKTLVDGINAKLDDMKKSIEGKANTDAIDGLQKSIADMVEAGATKDELEAKFKEVKDLINENGKQIKTMKISVEGLTLKQQIVKGLEGVKAQLNELKSGQNSHFQFEVKAAANMTTSNLSETIPPQIEFTPGVIPTQRNKPFVFDICNVAGTDKPLIQWVNEANADGAVAIVAEAGAKPLVDFDLTVETSTAEKIAAHIKVSMEMLDDLPFIAGEIENNLLVRLALVRDTEMLEATNASWSGLIDAAGAYTITGLDDAIDNAQNVDALVAAATQIRTLNFEPNYVILNPVDAAKIKLLKDADNAYILPPFATVDGTIIDNVRVIESNQMTAGDFLIGDFTKANVKTYGGIMVKRGLDGNDFTNNLVTIIAEQRVHFYIASNHTGAFCTGTLATVAAELETP